MTDAAATGERIELLRAQNSPRGRFRVMIGERQVAELDFVDRGGVWDLTHTFAEPEFRGTGLAGRLVSHVMEKAKAAGVSIVPSCPYLPMWLSRHPEYGDLVQAGTGQPA